MQRTETLPDRALEVREELFQLLLEKDPQACRSSFENGFQYAYEIQQQLVDERDQALNLAMSNIKMITETMKKANQKRKVSKIIQPAMQSFVNPKYRS